MYIFTQGLHRLRARGEVLKHLKDSDALEDAIEYSGSIGICGRTGDFIEPRVLPHWFLQTKTLTDMFLEHIKSKNIVILPSNQSEVLVHKLKNPQ